MANNVILQDSVALTSIVNAEMKNPAFSENKQNK